MAQTLSVAQMYALARGAGLNPARAVIAAAVGMAESSGRTAVTSPNPDGGVNVGPWQLDTKGKGAGYTVAQLQNPATNAKVMAKGTNNGADWSAWQAFTSGAYMTFIGQAQTAAGSETSGGSGWLQTVLKDITGAAAGGLGESPGASGALGQLLQLPSQITGFFTALEQPVKAALWLVNPTNWARIMAGAFGFLLLAAGLITLGMAA